MGAVKDAVTRVEHALTSEGRESVNTALGVLQELPVTVADALTVTGLAEIIEVWLEEHPVSRYACAECGTNTATSYVVTTLDPSRPDETTTEVCLPCHEILTAS